MCVITFLVITQNYDGFVFAEEANDDNQGEEDERTGTIIGIDLGTTYSEYYYFIVGLNIAHILHPHLVSDLQFAHILCSLS